MVCHSGLLITVPFCYCQQWSCHRDVFKTKLPICNVWLSGINCILKWFFGSLSDSLTAQPLFLSLFCFLYYGVILRAVPWSESTLHRGNLRRHFTILAETGHLNCISNCPASPFLDDPLELGGWEAIETLIFRNYVKVFSFPDKHKYSMLHFSLLAANNWWRRFHWPSFDDLILKQTTKA